MFELFFKFYNSPFSRQRDQATARFNTICELCRVVARYSKSDFIWFSLMHILPKNTKNDFFCTCYVVVFHYLVNDFDVNEHWINYSRYNLWSGMKSRILWTWPRGRHVKDWPLCFEEFILLLFDVIYTRHILLYRCMCTCVQYIETEKKRKRKIDWISCLSV